MKAEQNFYVAALDLGGTNAVCALVDQEGNLHFKEGWKTREFSSPEALAQAVALWLKEKAQKPDILVLGMGVGAPSGNRQTGTLDFAPNLPWKGRIPLARLISEATGLPCALDNDANAAAYGEWLFGGARGLRDFVVITLGTGVGSGIVCDGRMIYGHQALGAELGHVILQPEGRLCGCGRRGCVEAYCSATGFMITFRELAHQEGFPELAERVRSPWDAKNLADEGHSVARTAFRITGEWLGLALANCCAFSNPQALFLTGGLVGAGEYLLQPTRSSFEKNVLSVYKDHTRIEISALPGENAALLGAASVFQKTRKKTEG